MHSTNKDIIHLAGLIDRTLVHCLRLVNFASVDPALQARGIKGMNGGDKNCTTYLGQVFHNQEELIFKENIINKRKHFD
jgi:putative restriction endonuclease